MCTQCLRLFSHFLFYFVSRFLCEVLLVLLPVFVYFPPIRLSALASLVTPTVCFLLIYNPVLSLLDVSLVVYQLLIWPVCLPPPILFSNESSHNSYLSLGFFPYHSALILFVSLGVFLFDQLLLASAHRFLTVYTKMTTDTTIQYFSCAKHVAPYFASIESSFGFFCS